MDAAAEYKRRVEARVTGHSGTTFLEVLVITLAAVFVNALSTAAATTTTTTAATIRSRAIEWMLLVPPLLILYSSPSESMTFHIAAAIVVPCLLLFTLKFKPWLIRNKSGFNDDGEAERQKLQTRSGSSSSSSYDPATAMLRSTLMLQTIVAILEVDFPIFPHRFMKCESFGISLMDVGVGAFVFSAAVTRVAADERRRAANQNKKKTATSSSYSALKELTALLGSSIPLFILGFVRLASVAVTGYQEHITEYGKHWNFFLTLGSMPLVVALAHRTASSLVSGVRFITRSGAKENRQITSETETTASFSNYHFDAILGALLLLIHQTALSHFSLTEYVMSEHRRTLIESNKEGIISSVGYSALYLMARGLFGALCFSSSFSNSRSSCSSTHGNFSNILAAKFVGAVISLFAYFLHTSLQQFSRRLCNAPYVLFCLGIGFLTYSVCGFVVNVVSNNSRSASPSPASSSVKMLNSVGDNQLPLFLLANLGTGLINKAMYTIDASTAASYVVMLVYVTAVLVVATILSNRKIKLKFW